MTGALDRRSRRAVTGIAAGHDHVGPRSLICGPRPSRRVDRVAALRHGGFDSREIDKEPVAAEPTTNAGLDRVTGGSRFIGDERGIAADDGIEKAALADVGPAQEDNPRQVAGGGIAARQRRRGPSDRVLAAIESRRERPPRRLRRHGVRRRLVGKIDRSLDVGEQVEQIVAHACQRRPGPAAESIEGNGEFRGGPRIDHAEHRLGLHEVEPAGEKRPQCELAAAGQSRAQPACFRDHRIDQGCGGGQLHLGERPAYRPRGPRPDEHLDRQFTPVASQPFSSERGPHRPGTFTMPRPCTR